MTSTDIPGLHLDELGRRIRQLRTDKGLTLSELAELSRVSIGMLSHIERGHASPSLKTLERLRIALKVQLADFFAIDASSADDINIVVRKNGRSTLPFNKFGLTKELLSPKLHSNLEMLMLVLQPGGSSGPEPWTRNGEKAGYMLEGQLQLTVGSQSYLLYEGDSFRFDSSIEHAFRNPTNAVSRIIWVIKSDVFA